MKFVSVKLNYHWREVLLGLVRSIYEVNEDALIRFKDSTVILDHMTIAYNPKITDPLMTYGLDHAGETVKLYIKGFGWSDKAFAFAVDTLVPSKNAFKHITIAVAEGGSPVDSNNIEVKKLWQEKDWIPAEGTVMVEDIA